MNGKTALITGITGQDGSYLAELLLEKGYSVHGIVRRSSTSNTKRIDHIAGKINIHVGDLTDSASVSGIISSVKPDEVYNLAAQSHVGISFENPVYTADVDALGTLRLLESLRIHSPNSRFYQASTSELFGKVQEIPQKETTPFYPRSPYATAKLFSYWIVRNYRESYGMFASNGILFNHESPRRGENFVTRKVTKAVARIKMGLQKNVVLGDMLTTRDWGYASDYVYGMWLILQHDKPDDFVLSTGIEHSIEDLCEIAFSHVGLNWKDYVVFDEKFVRPNEVCRLLGDSSKARNELGWMPKTSFSELVEMMVDEDLSEINGVS